MNTCRFLILATFCVVLLVLFVQGENENEISETDVELQDHNLREKRSIWWRRRTYPRRSRRIHTRRIHTRRRYRPRPPPRYCPSYTSLLKIVLKGVDCRNNAKCQLKQNILFGKPTPSPSSSPVMSATPSSSQVAPSMPPVSPTPSSSSVLVSQTVSEVNN